MTKPSPRKPSKPRRAHRIPLRVIDFTLIDPKVPAKPEPLPLEDFIDVSEPWMDLFYFSAKSGFATEFLAFRDAVQAAGAVELDPEQLSEALAMGMTASETALVINLEAQEFCL